MHIDAAGGRRLDVARVEVSAMEPSLTSSPAAYGDPRTVAALRAYADLRAGRPIRIAEGRRAIVAIAIDGLGEAQHATFVARVAGGPMALALAGRRAERLGLVHGETVATLVPVEETAERAVLSAIASSETPPPVVGASLGGRAELAAVELAKLAGLLPAMLVAPARDTILNGTEAGLLEVDADAALGLRRHVAGTIRRVSSARVPIAADIDTRFVVYRDALGSQSIAVIVGDPDPSRPVPIRIHSSCATGDIFGSRRCDCGDQLQLALERIDELGSGAVLYMDQEGRGLGLANKMRAYELQDRGLDTVDANTALGYHEDERDYTAATRILADLGWKSILLLTNNPAKVDALREAGIEVADRLPVLAPVNAENRRYLEVKAARSGHLLEHIRGGH